MSHGDPPIYARVDATDEVSEANESNNHHSIQLSRPTPTPTPTAVPSAEPSPSPTARAEPEPLFLPLALRERCTPKQQRVDVVLVIDASTSMLGQASSGIQKLAAAKAAVLAFLALLEGSDQAAMVAFNADATLLQPLTASRPLLQAAVRAISPARQTCLVCGVARAADELSSPRRRASNAPVMVVLTDGRSNPRPASEAVTRAARATAAGVTVFTIGLGTDLDIEALEQIASRPAYFYHAPDAGELLEIYTAIAGEIPCAADRFWGGQ